MMQFGKIVRFLGMLLLGMAIALMAQPVNAQDFDAQVFEQELKNCYVAISQYEDYDDLDKHEESELYCLFLIELADGGIDVDQEYDTDRLDDLILAALSDEGDATGSSTADTFLRYSEIEEEFTEDELALLIRQAIEQADWQTAMPAFLPMYGLKAIAPKHPKASNGATPAIAQSSNGRARGGSAASAFANGASRQARRD